MQDTDHGAITRTESYSLDLDLSSQDALKQDNKKENYEGVDASIIFATLGKLPLCTHPASLQ